MDPWKTERRGGEAVQCTAAEVPGPDDSLLQCKDVYKEPCKKPKIWFFWFFTFFGLIWFPIGISMSFTNHLFHLFADRTPTGT